MITRKTTLPALALAALLGGTGLSAFATQAVLAQATTAPPQTQQPERPRFSPSRHIEGRIAYLKAELKITAAQAPQFDRVAQAMRENARAMEQVAQQMRGNRDQQRNAVQRLETRAQFASLRAQADQRFLEAFRPLYASLSDEQKKTADEALASRHGHFRHG